MAGTVVGTPMDKQDVADAIIPLIYDACDCDDLWSQIVLQISDEFGGASVGYVLQDLTGAGASFNALAHFDKDLTDLHFEEYDTPQKNPGVAALFRAPLCQPFSLNSFLDTRTYEADPSAQAILKPQKIDKGLFVAFERDAGTLGFMNLLKRTDQCDFEPHQAQTFAVLSRHMARAAKLRRLTNCQASRQAIADERSGRPCKMEGAVMLAVDGKVLDADAGARAIFKSQSTLVLRKDRLRSTAMKSSMNDEIMQTFLTAGNAPHYPFVLAEQGRSLITLDVLPAHRSPSGQSARPVVICRSFPHSAPNVKAFCTFYELSKAECRVVETLTSSPNATQAAKTIGISRDTIKSHLSRIYSKTESASLSQLMLLVGRFCSFGLN